MLLNTFIALRGASSGAYEAEEVQHLLRETSERNTR